MKKTTKKILVERINVHMQTNNIKNLSLPNPFPVSWRTINSLKASHKNDDGQSFSTATQRRLLDFFQIAYYRDGRDYIALELNNQK